MSLRIGFDMDGVLADFESAYHEIEARLYGPARVTTRADDPEEEAGKQDEQDDARERRGSDVHRRRNVIWQAIQATPDFWMALKPLDPAAVKRIQEMALAIAGKCSSSRSGRIPRGTWCSGRRSAGSLRRDSIYRACW